MPVHVHLPFKVKVPRSATAADLARLETAVGGRMLRALERSDQEVLEPRGRRAIRIHPAEFAFKGEAIAEPIRVAIERAVRRGHDSALQTWEPSTPLPRAVAALSGVPLREPADPRRLDRLRRRYTLDFYDGPSEGSLPFEAPYLYSVFEYVWLYFRDRVGDVWDPEQHGYPGFYGPYKDDEGVVHRDLVFCASGTVQMAAEDPSVPDSPMVKWLMAPELKRISLPKFLRMKKTEKGDLVAEEAKPFLPERWMTLSATGMPASEENLRLYIRTAHGAMLDVPPENVEEAVEILARKGADAAQTIWAFKTRSGVTTSLLMMPIEPTYDPVHFFNLEFSMPGTGEGKGGGGTPKSKKEGGSATEKEGEGGGGTGTGTGTGAKLERSAGGPLGTADGTGPGRLWPVHGASGEELVCESFMSEPALEELPANSAKDLAAKIREIANLLEVPPCGFAAKFCINAASVIGGRAHAVGMAAVKDTSKNTVTVNGEEMQITPGRSDALMYMKVLGRAAVMVARLSVLMYEIYEANRVLIEKKIGRSFHGHGWAITYINTFHDTLSNSCMFLYAETCRVLMLQQLRTSKEFIEARQKNLDETTKQINAVLGTVGEGLAAKMSLRKAIQVAPWKDLYAEGAMPRPPMVELPPDASIEKRGEAYVAVWDGREWTEKDLSSAIGYERGILNMLDPLFLQFPEVEGLLRKHAKDPEAVKKELKKLLDTMHEANGEIMEECTDGDDGAWFALESSRYVEAQGGLNRRLLKYDLYGIHAMADQELFPEMGHLDDYRRGINKAIGRKHQLDLFWDRFTIVASILCPPLGVVAGVASTIRDVMRADELETIYRALEDPESVLSWQEVEMEWFMAYLSIAFTALDFIPFARAGTKAAMAAIKGELKAGLRAAAKEALRNALRKLAKEIVEQSLEKILLAGGIMVAMREIMPVVMNPLIEDIQAGVVLAHGVSEAEILRMGEEGLEEGEEMPAEEGAVEEEGAAPADEPPIDDEEVNESYDDLEVPAEGPDDE